jgi:hypothetical protein
MANEQAGDILSRELRDGLLRAASAAHSDRIDPVMSGAQCDRPRQWIMKGAP